jgi:hypothetical protein
VGHRARQGNGFCLPVHEAVPEVFLLVEERFVHKVIDTKLACHEPFAKETG